MNSFIPDSEFEEAKAPSPRKKKAALRLVRPGQNGDQFDSFQDLKAYVESLDVADREPFLKARAERLKMARYERFGYIKEMRRRAENIFTAFLNKSHALMEYGSDVLVCTRRKDYEGNVELLYRKSEAVAKLYKRYTITFPKVTAGGKVSINGDEKNPIDIWLNNKKVRHLQGVINAPGLDAGPEWMNLWSGWGCKPKMIPVLDKKGNQIIGHNSGLAEWEYDFSGQDCPLILNHIREVLCAGDEGFAKWFIAWCADIVQNPRDKKGTGVILYGPQGGGKSAFAEWIMAPILGSGFTQERSSNFMKEEAGQTSALGRLMIVAEEAFFSGDPRVAALLKTFVTQPKLSVRSLYKDAINVPNHARVLAFMNPQASGGHTIQVENDDRRWAIGEISDKYVGNREYFGKLKHECENGGVEAFFAYLMNPALFEGVDLLKGYETPATIEQKVYSLPSQEAYIYECLRSGTLQLNMNSECQQPWSDDETVDKKAFFAAYLEWCKVNKRDYPGTPNAFNKKLTTCLGEPATYRNSKNQWLWKLGSLEQARRAFQKWIRCEDDWAHKLWTEEAELKASIRREEADHDQMWSGSEAETPPTHVDIDQFADDDCPF